MKQSSCHNNHHLRHISTRRNDEGRWSNFAGIYHQPLWSPLPVGTWSPAPLLFFKINTSTTADATAILILSIDLCGYRR